MEDKIYLRDWTVVAVLAIVGFCVAIALGVLNGYLFYHDFSQDAGLMGYHKTASSLLHTFSFHNEKELFFETIRRPPGYPIFLALSYALLGERLLTVWIVQMILWIMSIGLFWRISRRFLDGREALIPPFLLACWWGIASQVFVVNVEIFAFFLIIVFLWAWLRYGEEQRTRWIGISAIAFAWFVLIKAPFLYFIPLLIVLFIITMRPLNRRVIRDGVAALFIMGIIIGSWSFYSYYLLGTFQLASGGLTVMRRADDVLLSGDRIKQFFVASLTNDYVADRLFSGYADNPEPINKETRAREKTYAQRLLPDKSNEAILQKELGEATRSLIVQAPIKFIATAFPYLIRLNRPLTPRGDDIDQLFIGTRSFLSPTQKVASILAFLGIWYSFVIGTFLGAIQCMRKKYFVSKWMLPLLVIFYTNGIYALLSHAEARYLFPAMPFYFLLFAFLLAKIKTKVPCVVLGNTIEIRE
ncbi:MAG: glycosyltransferase family 39 protein [Patescibacteria group bacterium]